jgi:WD repeat-containing protein 19
LRWIVPTRHYNSTEILIVTNCEFPGTVEVYCISERQMLPGIELRLEFPIRKLIPNSTGTRVVVVDSSNRVLLFNPVLGGGVNQSITKFDYSPPNIVSVLWDAVDKTTIYIYDGKCLHTYSYASSSMKGALLTKLGIVDISSEGDITLTPGAIDLVSGNVPVLCSAGFIVSQNVTGGLVNSVHHFFDQLNEKAEKRLRNRQQLGKSEERMLMNRFCQAIALMKLEVAWDTALELDLRNFWIALSSKAMEVLNIELATRVYRQLRDAGMVMALQHLAHVEDRQLLSGHLCLLFGDYQHAQELFLASSQPTEALVMRKNLLHWEQALKLAQTLDPNSIPEVCVHFGQQLEFRDDTQSALSMYEAALNGNQQQESKVEVVKCPDSLVPVAMMGLARYA